MTAFIIIDGEEISTEDVKVLGIEEGIHGEDILECMYKGKTYWLGFHRACQNKKTVYRKA